VKQRLGDSAGAEKDAAAARVLDANVETGLRKQSILP
jgi:hypothetical protein